MHTSIGAKLLTQKTNLALCKSCHSKGLGADAAVIDGIYLDAQDPSHSFGSSGGILLGGGFDRIGDASTTTSKHDLEASPTQASGSDSPYMSLACISCHTPHQGPNYRLLRRRPGGVTSDIDVPWNGPWTDSTQSVKGGDYQGYTEKDFDPSTPGIQYYTNNYKDNIDEWCVTCHIRYRTRGDANNQAGDDYDAGDIYGKVPRFRHATDIPIQGETDPFNGLSYNMITDLPLEDVAGDGRTPNDKMTCITCHRSHGTEAVMTGYADFAHSLYGGDRGSLPTNSMHLRQANRGVCVQCHTMGTF